MKLVDIDK